MCLSKGSKILKYFLFIWSNQQAVISETYLCDALWNAKMIKISTVYTMVSSRGDDIILR